MTRFGFLGKNEGFATEGKIFVVRIFRLILSIGLGRLTQYEPPRCPNCRELMSAPKLPDQSGTSPTLTVTP